MSTTAFSSLGIPKLICKVKKDESDSEFDVGLLGRRSSFSKGEKTSSVVHQLQMCQTMYEKKKKKFKLFELASFCFCKPTETYNNHADVRMQSESALSQPTRRGPLNSQEITPS